MATKAGNWVLVTCILASSLSFIDGSVVNVGLPAIGKSLRADAAALQWIINAYLLPLGALLLLGGAAGDRYGRRRLLIWGTALFGLASLACAAAPNLGVLLAARAAQGVGAAILLPNSLATLGASFEGAARGRAVGIWAAAGAVMGAVGPVLGGWLIDSVGWRTIFLINLPPAIGAIILALVFVRDAAQKETSPLDVMGGVLATVALGAITWGLTIGTGPGGWTVPAVALEAAGLAMAAAFVWVEYRRGDKAMMPLALFGSATAIGLNLLTLLLYGAMGTLLVLAPYVLIEAAGYSGTAAGAALLPFAALMGLASPLAGSLADRTGPRLPLTVGPMVVAGGFVLMTRIGERAHYWSDVFPAILVIAIGMTIAVAPLTAAVLSSVDSRHTGSASGLNSAVARTAGMIATALLGGVLAARGQALVAGFHVAVVVCAAASLGAGIVALCLVPKGRRNETKS